MTPLNVGSLQPIVDELGRTLEGRAGEAGDAVQILRATKNVIHPPQANGQPHPDNLLVAKTSIGNLAPRHKARPGLFSISLPDRQGMNTNVLFVRIFNATDPSDATFYGDSQLYTVSADHNAFPVNIESTDKPIDPSDDDADGLVNSMEMSLGTNPGSKDTDGDGMSDGHEYRAGTDALDRDAYLRITRAERLGESIRLFWDAADGKQYQVVTTRDSLAAKPVFIPFGPVVTASGPEAFIDVPAEWIEHGRHFRVRLVETAP